MKPLLEVLESRGILSRIPANWHVHLSSYTYVEEHKRRRFYGLCNYQQKQIILCALGLLTATSEQNETILHECAHALDFAIYRRAGHGSTWRSIARKLGVNPSASKSSAALLTRDQQDMRRMGLPMAAILALTQRDSD